MAYMLLIMEPHGQRAERGLAGGAGGVCSHAAFW